MLAAHLARQLDPAQYARAAGFEPDPWQAAFLRSTSRRTLILACRQAGKTESCILKSLHVADTEPGSLILVAAPSLRQSSEFIRRARLAHQRIDGAVPLKNDNLTRLEFANESRLVGLPGDNDGDTIRGLANARLVLIDEASRVSDALVAALRPTLAVNKRGTLIALTTPAGQRGFFHSAWNSDDPEWERVRVTTDMVPRLTPEFLESERKALGRAFESEYGLVFHDDEMSAFSSELIFAALDPEVKPLWR
jgi:hypothetical protein